MNKILQQDLFKPVTHVIFDMDGTLINTEIVHKQTFIQIAKEHGKEFPDDLRLKILGTQEIDCATLIINTLKLDLTPAAFLDRVHAIEETKMANVKFMLGVETLLEHLCRHDIPMAVATSSSAEAYAIKTSHLKDQFSVFDHVVTGSSDPEVKNGKPAPDIFKICASRFLKKPNYSECLVFEDSPNGVAAAKAAGMQVIMVPDHDMPVNLTREATLVLDSIEDFLPEMFTLPSYGPSCLIHNCRD